MVAAAGGESVKFEVEQQGQREMFVRAAKFDEELGKALRTNIRGAALSMVADVRTKVMGGSFTTDAGMRQGIADGLKVQPLGTSKARSGVVLVATAAAMPDGKAAMVKAWQKRTFKHEVFGNADVVVEQEGRPYFEQTVRAKQKKVTTAVVDAMEQAAATLSTRSGI